MKTYEAREMTYAELVEKLEEAKDDLFNLRFQLAVSQSDNTARLGELRRDIARMRTVLNEWERDGRPLGYEEGEYEWESPPVDETDAEFPEEEEDITAEEEDAGPILEEETAAAPSDEQEEQDDDSVEEQAEEEAKPRRRWGRRSKK